MILFFKSPRIIVTKKIAHSSPAFSISFRHDRQININPVVSKIYPKLLKVLRFVSDKKVFNLFDLRRIKLLKKLLMSVATVNHYHELLHNSALLNAYIIHTSSCFNRNFRIFLYNFDIIGIYSYGE